MQKAPTEGACPLPAGRYREGAPRALGTQQPAKPLKKNPRKEKSLTLSKAARLQHGRRMHCSFGGIPHHSSFPFLGRNESVSQHCRASAEQDGAEGEACHKGNYSPARQEPGPGGLQVCSQGETQPGHQPHTHTSGCSGQLLQLRKQGKAVPLPSWSQVPLHSSALPRANTSVGARMLVPSPTAGHGEQGRLGSLEKESLLPQVSPVPLLLGSGICTGESFKARRGTEQGKTTRMLFPSTEAVSPHAPAATPTQS